MAPWGIPGAPVYVRIFRQSQFVTLQASGDGVNWVGTGGGDWGLGTVYVGLAVTSHANGRYATGTFDNVRVEVRPQNLPAAVAITQPGDGEVFFAPARVPITVTAHDPGYGIKEVSLQMLFGDSWSIFANFRTSDGWTSPYRATTRDLSAGIYRIRAVVLDNQNGITHSDPVTFRVTDGSLGLRSKHVSLFATAGRGLAFQVRRTEGATSEHNSGPAAYAPVWLRLVRTGNVFVAFYRHQHEQGWRRVVGTDRIVMPATICSRARCRTTASSGGTLARCHCR